MQAYAYGKFLGELTVRFDGAGEIISANGEQLVMDAWVEEDKAVVARLATLAKPLPRHILRA